MTTVAVEKTYTIADYEALPEDGKRYELVAGKLIEMAGGREDHARISSILNSYLGMYVIQNKLGVVYNSDARFITVGGERPTVRQAGVSFMQTDRVTRGVVTIPYAPDLAVEVISPGNDFVEIERKVREYCRAGAQLVWVIEIEDQVAHIYRAGSNQRQTINVDDELDGEQVVPGFKIKLGRLFE
jgi:Uma2 family endonuclease